MQTACDYMETIRHKADVVYQDLAGTTLSEVMHKKENNMSSRANEEDLYGTAVTNVIQIIQQHTNELINRLKSREHALIDSVHQVCQDKKAKLAHQVEDICKFVSQCFEISHSIRSQLQSKEYTWITDNEHDLVAMIDKQINTAQTFPQRIVTTSDINFRIHKAKIFNVIDNFGEIDTCSTCASQCKIESGYISCKQSVTDKYTSFRLIANDDFGVARSTGGEADLFHVSICRMNHDNQEGVKLSSLESQIRVIDRGQGIYCVSYKVTEAGLFSLSITYKGEHIHESPFKLLIKPTWFSLNASSNNQDCKESFINPECVCCSPDGMFVYATDDATDHPCVHVLCGNTGQYLSKIGESYLTSACGIAICAQGMLLYVADRKSKCILVFRTDDGSLVNKIGEGVLSAPFAVHMSHDELLYVSDLERQSVLVFRAFKEHDYVALGCGGGGSCISGSSSCSSKNSMKMNMNMNLNHDHGNMLVFEFGHHHGIHKNASDNALLQFPSGICSSKDGLVLVCDRKTGLISVFLAIDGSLLRQFGQFNNDQTAISFIEPYGISCSKDGLVYVSDIASNKVSIFRLSDASFLQEICQFKQPRGIFASSDNLVYVVADANNFRLSAFPALDASTLPSVGLLIESY
jgi:6-phosphogluconolactonase (cycloisomerase 2 family)